MWWIVVPFVVAGVLIPIIVAAVYYDRLNNCRWHIIRHMGSNCRKADVRTHPIKPWERINIYRALERLRLEAKTDLLGFQGRWDQNLYGVVLEGARRAGINWLPLECGFEKTQDCPQNAIFLLRKGTHPFCARLTNLLLEVVALTPEISTSAVKLVYDLSIECSVYKGQAISLTDPEEYGDSFSIKFQDIAPVKREDIILPADLMEVVERNVLSFLHHADTLRRSGRSTRHGVLFHGPPGVGKTLVTRYLVQACTKSTIIILTGANMRFIRESMRLARLLAPSVIVFEDVDLIAEERSTNRAGTILHEMLDELDGMGRRTECILLLTTNRPDMLEPALASRPGRVDQAIFFGLPDAEHRERLMRLYGHGLDLKDIDLTPWVEKTEGASPAFIAEWLRKAALMAAERGETEPPLKMIEADFDKALKELIFSGGKLTQNLLGFQVGDMGFKTS